VKQHVVDALKTTDGAELVCGAARLNIEVVRDISVLS
jgi:hypothetical protein